jgi:hypothetical protein
LENDSDCDIYQGHSYTRLYIEEAATFPSEGPINKLQATLRSGQGVPCQMKATMNPGGPGHHWCKARYKLDTHPGGMEVFKFAWTNPFTKKQVEKTRVFIPSRVVDNTYLSDDYIASLFQTGSPELVRMWLDGDWSFVLGAFFQEWSARNIVEPFAIPDGWLRFRSIDWGTFRPLSVGWWAVPGDDHHLGDGRIIPRGAMVRYREWYGAQGPNIGIKMPAEEVWAEADKEKSVDVQSIRLVLNGFELVAIGIQFGTFDYELIRRWNKSAILTYWRHGAPFVFALRARTKNDAVYHEFEEMARWLKDNKMPRRNWWFGKFF